MLHTIEVTTGHQPQHSVIWMHGLGADAWDFVPVVQQMMQSAQLPPIRFVFPNAPQIPVTINNGYVMPAWYDILSMDIGAHGGKREDETGLRQNEQAIVQLIEHQQSLGIASERIALAGFSQGCAMTLQTGLRYNKRLAGLIGLSGYLPLFDTIEAERNAANQGTPVFLAHGTQDPVVPYTRGKQAYDKLKSLQYDAQWHEYPMPHAVHPREIADIAQFLQRIFG